MKGPLPSAAEIEGLVRDAHPHDRLREGHELAHRVVPPLDAHRETLDREELARLTQHALGEQEKRRVGAFERIALGLLVLDLVEQPAEARVALVELDADTVELGEHIRLAGLIGNQHAAPIADAFGHHMLISAWVLQDGGSVDAGLGGEGGSAHEGRVPIRRAVQDFVERPRDMRELAQPLFVDADVETAGEGGLQLQGADQGHEIGVAAALAEAVQRALDLARAGFDRRERIRDRAAAIVMGVNAEAIAGNDLRGLGDDAPHLVGQGAAVRVAQHDPACAGVMRRLGTSESVLGVLLVAVEVMLAIDDRLAPLRDDHADALRDGGEIILERGLERHPHLVVGSLGDEHDGVGGTVEERGEARIIRRRTARAPRHAEGGKTRRSCAFFLEELRVLRIGAGIAAFDIGDAEPVEHGRHLALVLERKIDARHLRAVAQRRVEEMQALARGHAAIRSAQRTVRREE